MEPTPAHSVKMTRERRGPWLQLLSPVGFEWNSLTLPIANLPDELVGLRIVHLTDLHVRPRWTIAYDQLVERIDRAAPDLLLITGDFIDDVNNPEPALPILRRLLTQLRARLGVFGIFGNHDVDLMTPIIRESGVHLIDGGRALLRSENAAIELIGLPGIARFDCDRAFINSLPPRPQNALRVVMSHFPDHIRRMKRVAPDVFLCGHTHGGQICLPGGRALLTHDKLPKRMSKGIFRADKTWIVISRGFGFAGIPARVFCPGEVIEITMVRE